MIVGQLDAVSLWHRSHSLAGCCFYNLDTEEFFNSGELEEALQERQRILRSVRSTMSTVRSVDRAMERVIHLQGDSSRTVDRSTTFFPLLIYAWRANVFSNIDSWAALWLWRAKARRSLLKQSITLLNYRRHQLNNLGTMIFQSKRECLNTDLQSLKSSFSEPTNFLRDPVPVKFNSLGAPFEATTAPDDYTTQNISAEPVGLLASGKTRSFSDAYTSRIMSSKSSIICPEEIKEIIEMLEPSYLEYFSSTRLICLVLGAIGAHYAVHNTRYWIESGPIFLTEVITASKNLLHDWIWNPIQDVWRTIRYSKVSAISLALEAGETERRLLDELVSKYSFQDNSLSFSREDFTENEQLKFALEKINVDFARAVGKPWTSIMSGRLLTLLMIQAQRVKVDFQTALGAIDRLLKSNELNFELLAVVPVLGFLWLSIGSGSRLLSELLGKDDRDTCRRISNAFVDLERSINAAVSHELDPEGTLTESMEEVTGELLIKTQTIIDLWTRLSWKLRRGKLGECLDDELAKDLAEILSEKRPSCKMNVVQRIMNRSIYPFSYSTRFSS